MKYRKDFVTNSSSSSFICDVCGETQCGYDLSLEDAQMVECINGHTFCESHLVKEIDFYGEDEDIRYNVPIDACPICQFQAVHIPDAYKYLMKKLGLTKEGLLEEMKSVAPNYKEFRETLK